MEIFQLPDYFEQSDPGPIQLVDYRSQAPIRKSKIVLNKNAFSFLREGFKEVIADNAARAIDNRDFLIMKSGRCLMTENLSQENQSYRSILLFFTDEVLLEFLGRNFPNHAHRGLPPFFEVSRYDGFIRQFVDSLQQLSTLAPELQQRLLPVKFEEIMHYLAQMRGPEFLYGLLGDQDQRERQFSEIVDSARLTRLTVQEVAFLCNRSLSAFKREFQRHYGTSPAKWFLDQRMTHSAFLLRTGQKRPTDLYEEVGFESLSTFTQAFKKHFGITPKQYQLDKVDV